MKSRSRGHSIKVCGREQQGEEPERTCYDGDEFGEIMVCQPENRNELVKCLKQGVIAGCIYLW